MAYEANQGANTCVVGESAAPPVRLERSMVRLVAGESFTCEKTVRAFLRDGDDSKNIARERIAKTFRAHSLPLPPRRAAL